MSIMDTVSAALDAKFDRPDGLYGRFEDIPTISQEGHARRMALLADLDIGNVAGKVCADFGMGGWGFAGIYPRLHDCGRAIGMDVSTVAIEQSKALARDARLPYADRFECHQSDGSSLPLPDASVDLLFCGESIEHVRFPPRFLSEVHRVLKPSGQLVLTTPNRDAVVYRLLAEEYCTSPEHFWLFGYGELRKCLEEFFLIEEVYGFNGSFGPEMDRGISDRSFASVWSGSFRDAPELATGTVLRARRRDDVRRRYVVTDVPEANIQVLGEHLMLDLEFGLRGRMMDRHDALVRVVRPASDGIVLRFWCHRWSGIATIERGGMHHRLDLYAMHPGWRHWVCDESNDMAELIDAFPSGEANSKALSRQTIFFEAFTWRVVA